MSNIIEEGEIPIEEDDIPTDDVDFEEVEEEITVIEWDKDEFETDTETD